MATGLRKIQLSTTPTDEALAALQIGDIVYLDGIIYTAREGVYMRVIDDGVDLPLDLPMASAANFHCSPAATQHEDGSYTPCAVTATASFRFSKWIGAWLASSGAKLIIGKGGMSPRIPRSFCPAWGNLSDHRRLWHWCVVGARCQGGV